MTDTLATIVGSFGAAGLLWAFFAVSTRRRIPEDLAVLLANFVGSLLLVVNTWHFHAWPPLVVNSVWAVIAVVTFRQSRRLAATRRD